MRLIKSVGPDTVCQFKAAKISHGARHILKAGRIVCIDIRYSQRSARRNRWVVNIAFSDSSRRLTAYHSDIICILNSQGKRICSGRRTAVGGRDRDVKRTDIIINRYSAEGSCSCVE